MKPRRWILVFWLWTFGALWTIGNAVNWKGTPAEFLWLFVPAYMLGLALGATAWRKL